MISQNSNCLRVAFTPTDGSSNDLHVKWSCTIGSDSEELCVLVTWICIGHGHVVGAGC